MVSVQNETCHKVKRERDRERNHSTNKFANTISAIYTTMISIKMVETAIPHSFRYSATQIIRFLGKCW